MGDSADRTLAASWESEVPGLAGFESEPPLPLVPGEEETPEGRAPAPVPTTQIGILPGPPGNPLRFMLGSSTGMSIGDRPLNTMRVRRDGAAAARVRPFVPSGSARPAPLLLDAPQRRVPRFRGISLDEFEGGWL